MVLLQSTRHRHSPEGVASQRRPANVGRRWSRMLLRALTYPQSPDDYLQALHPDWTLQRVVATITQVCRETADTTSLYLKPSRNWQGHCAGQHVLLTVTLQGVQYTRCFTLSAAPRPHTPLRLTIKTHRGGVVSGWARDAARVGERVLLGRAQGQFVLPRPVPDALLFVSGGSGLTPLLAMAQALVDAGYRGSLRWIHSEQHEVALLDEMQGLCATLGTTLVVHWTGGSDTPALLTPADIAAEVPDYRERALFMCGPHGLMDVARALYRQAGLGAHVHEENFQPRRASVQRLRAAGDRRAQLVLARSGRSIRAQPGASLLELAEGAGLHPPHGCRRGICHTCKCTKHEGTVRNELTGIESDARDEEIRLCIHSAITDVTIDL